MTYRLLTFGWLACLVTALWIAALTPQAGGYELSLMNAYPPVFWALTIAASILSSSILLLLAARETRSPWWASGVLGILATNIFVLSLPLFRGYPVSDRADSMNHIGYARDILATGRISDLDFYPAQHLLQVALETIGGATPGQALILVNLLFAIIWTVGPALLSGRLAGDVRGAYLGAAFSATFGLLGYHTAPEPNMLSAMLIPVLLALHLRRSGVRGGDRAATTVAEIMLALLIVYFHPMTTLYLIVVLIAFDMASRIYLRLQRRFAHDPSDDAGFPHSLGLAAIMGIAFSQWYLSFSVITSSFTGVLYWLLGERHRQSALSEAFSQVQTARLPTDDLIRILANQFGVTALLIGLTCVLMAVLLYGSLHNRRLPPRIHVTFVAGFIVAIAAAAFMFSVSSAERYPIRLLRILVILSLGLLPWWCWEAVFRSAGSAHWPRLNPLQRAIALGTITSLLFAMIVMGQLNVYADPRNGLPNQQVTNSELSGMAWLVQHRSNDFVQASILPEYVPRFQAYFWGYAGQRTLGPWWWQDDIWLPSHFYKAEWRCMADISPGETAYLALSDAGRIAPLRFPQSVRQFAHIYSKEDWLALAADQSVSKLYDNGGFEVWMTDKKSRACS